MCRDSFTYSHNVKSHTVPLKHSNLCMMLYVLLDDYNTTHQPYNQSDIVCQDIKYASMSSNMYAAVYTCVMVV